MTLLGVVLELQWLGHTSTAFLLPRCSSHTARQLAFRLVPGFHLPREVPPSVPVTHKSAIAKGKQVPQRGH